MEAVALQKYIHTSPRKLRLVVDMVRSLSPNQALDVLNFTPKDAAKDISFAIKTALANAKKLGMDAEKAVFKKIEVDESSKMRRFRSAARGRVRPYKRRMSHIKIVLTDELTKNLELKTKKEGGSKQTGVVMDNSAVIAK